MMESVVASELPAFPPARTCPMQSLSDAVADRVDKPVARVTLPTGRTAWLVRGHRYVREILNDTRVSVDRTADGYPHMVDINPQAMALLAKINRALIGLDPPEHTVHRRLLLNEFTVKRMRSMRPLIQRVVDERIDAMLAAGPPVDLVQALSLPVPTLMICGLLGVPYEEHDFFQSRTHVLLNRKFSQQERAGALVQLIGYMDELVTEKEDAADEGDDLLARLVAKYRQAGLFDHEHMVSLGVLLLMAGHETSAAAISLGVLGLLNNPDQLALFQKDPSTAGPMIEELLRYWSTNDIVSGSRVATDDIEIGGEVIRKGDGVIALISGANHDGTVFAAPDTLDVERGARHHVSFGYGMHQCLGQNLARLELEVVFTTLFARVPDLRLAVPVDELGFKQTASIYGVDELPVTW